MRNTLFLSMLALVASALWSCDKADADEEFEQAQTTLMDSGPETIVPELGDNEPLTLTQELSGVYEGYRKIKNEGIDCPNCELPCDFSYSYDTTYVEVLVTYFNEDSITILDSYDGLFSRTIPIDSTLYYQGGPIHYQAPEGYLKLWFAGENNDSLILDGFEGGGNPCGGYYIYHDYHLVKQ